MNMIWILIGLTLLIILLLIIFSGVEYSFLISNPLTLELKRDQKAKKQSSLGTLLDNTDVFWRTTTSMNSICIILLSILLIKLFKRILANNILWPSVKQYFVQYDYMVWIITGVVALLILYISRSLIAKPIYQHRPENKVNGLSGLIIFFSKIMNPLMLFYKKIAESILVYLFNARVNKNASIFLGVNPYNFFRQSIQGQNVLDKLNKKFFRGAIDLTQISVRNCITPRTELLAIERNATIEDLKKKFVETKVSKILVYEKHLDNIIGYIHHLDMHTKPEKIEDILLQLQAVPGTMSALELVRIFTKERKSLALVVDEFGGTMGIVAMEDILEEIFGNIKDEFDSDELVEKKLTDNEFVFSGRLKVDYLNHKYGLNIEPSIAETLSGYIIEKYEAIPTQKQKIIIGKLEFEILLVTATKIESVRLRLLTH